MLKYPKGAKVVPVANLTDSPEWFDDEYVTISGYCSEGDSDIEHYKVVHYEVIPKDTGNDDYSWLNDQEINHEATEALNK